jgi:hypothetical protein
MPAASVNCNKYQTGSHNEASSYSQSFHKELRDGLSLSDRIKKMFLNSNTYKVRPLNYDLQHYRYFNDRSSIGHNVLNSRIKEVIVGADDKYSEEAFANSKNRDETNSEDLSGNVRSLARDILFA